ncbi:unnamed protein product [Adineta ricciae]|uniref:Uncharacterized protein n=1 Tax=Adineta ricciae TaxID=249248 RepID=A0A813WWW4_ADIRI|nr:unnamed protein product [Adineta ricciae]CAF1187002.1 unnamed protein product [Adineta ricciae]
MSDKNDWVFVENEDETNDELGVVAIEENTDENAEGRSKPSYAATLLRNIEPNHQQQQRRPALSSIGSKKMKSMNNKADEEKGIMAYVEAKPGSQYRNPRDKAGKNKVHDARKRSSSPPRNIGNSAKTGCSFCNTKLTNRIERTRNVRQQCSKVNWKDYDY